MVLFDAQVSPSPGNTLEHITVKFVKALPFHISHLFTVHSGLYLPFGIFPGRFMFGEFW